MSASSYKHFKEKNIPSSKHNIDYLHHCNKVNSFHIILYEILKSIHLIKWASSIMGESWVGLCLLCSKFYLLFFREFSKISPISLLCLAYYSRIILRRYTCIRNTSFKIEESNEVKSLVLTENCKQGTI